GGVCSRNGDCAEPGTLRSARITWTLYGRPPDDALCAGVAELAVTFHDLDALGDVTYQPVRCTLGLIYFDRMSPRLDAVTVAAFLHDGRIGATATEPLQGIDSIIEIDIRP